MVTIGEVAKYAGVSVATVSRVLNSSESVKAATAQRVMAAIRALDYVPNQSARNLRRSESRVILTLAPTFPTPTTPASWPASATWPTTASTAC